MMMGDTLKCMSNTFVTDQVTNDTHQVVMKIKLSDFPHFFIVSKMRCRKILIKWNFTRNVYMMKQEANLPPWRHFSKISLVPPARARKEKKTKIPRERLPPRHYFN